MEGMEGGQDAVVIRKGGSGGGVPILRTIWKIVDLVILAALVIGILLMWQETAVRDIKADMGMALAAKSKLDSLTAAQQANAPQTVELTEQEINAYMNDASSPRHFEYAPEPTGGGFSSRFTKYQLELGENEATAIGLAEIRLGGYKKKLVLRATGFVTGAPGGRRAEVSTAFIGKLPLHSLPFGGSLASGFAGYFFRFGVFEEELKLLKAAREVRIAGGKVTVVVGGSTAAPAAR
jgi:hypothetical protein